MKEIYVGKKINWIRFGFFSFPSFHLGINLDRYSFSLDLLVFYVDLEW
jgi:hypothetical protein